MRCFHKIFVFVVPRFEMRCRAEQEQGIHWVGQRAFPPHTPCFSCLQDVAETKTVSKMHKKWKKEGKNKTRRGKGSFYDDRFRYFFLPLVTKKEAEARVFQLQSPSQKVERTKNNETLRAHKKREKSILTTTTQLNLSQTPRRSAFTASLISEPGCLGATSRGLSRKVSQKITRESSFLTTKGYDRSVWQKETLRIGIEEAALGVKYGFKGEKR